VVGGFNSSLTVHTSLAGGGEFNWRDALNLESQLKEDEIMMR
jgi:hypothetical protein